MDPIPPATLEALLGRLHVLTLAQILRIDELLAAVGDYGEVQLIVQRRQLRYINKVESYKVDEGK
jgi:hypothetical protein